MRVKRPSCCGRVFSSWEVAASSSTPFRTKSCSVLSCGPSSVLRKWTRDDRNDSPRRAFWLAKRMKRTHLGVCPAEGGWGGIAQHKNKLEHAVWDASP